MIFILKMIQYDFYTKNEMIQMMWYYFYTKNEMIQMM